MAIGPKISSVAEAQALIEAVVDAAISRMSDDQREITVNLSQFENFRRETPLMSALRTAYVDAGWKSVEIITWEGARETGNSVFKIKLVAYSQ